MNKAIKALRALGMIARRPSLLNLVLNDEAAHRRFVEQKFGMGAGLPVFPIAELLPSEILVKPYAFLDGGCIPTDLALLRALCRSRKVTDYLEIGTWRGESVANVADEGVSCVSVNLPDQEMLQMGMSPDYVAMHRFFSDSLSNVTHIQAHSRRFDFGSLNRKFDLIFIDGDHHTESIIRDTRTAFSLLKNDDSVIVWHDYALSPETPRFEVLSGILQGCGPDEHRHLYHVSHSLCALYTRAAAEVAPLKINAKPNVYFGLDISTHQL